jgi:hypothetical protein
MSNALAIAAVTTTLRSLLMARLTAPPVNVTARPLDKARNGGTGNQLNLFLYQTMTDAAMLNTPIPNQHKPGETGLPPLPLTLYYLLSAYGQNDDDIDAHTLLGQAMSVLYDHPLLGTDEIKDACAASLPDSDLHNQIERIRITRETLSLEDISKLWLTFKSEYRISAAYQVSVVLIDSTRAAKTPLPVLTRGPADDGVTSQPNLNNPFPMLEGLAPPNRQFSALPGDLLTINGANLAGTNIEIRLTHRLLEDDLVLPPEAGNTDTSLGVTIPNNPVNVPAGFYSLVVSVTRPNETFSRTTNSFMFALAPEMTGLPIAVARVGGNATINVNCRPEVRPEQRATLLLGDREILADAHPAQTGALTFIVTNAVPGEYFVRLRIDGVDSLLTDRADENAPPTFDPTQKVTIT